MMHMELVKHCLSCDETKTVAEFWRAARGMPGYRTYCIKCMKAQRRASYVRRGGKDVPYEQLLKREYGITLADYNVMLRKQAHRCAICRRPETIRSKRTGELQRLAVDHDHVTMTVRGLLCHRCNILVWAFEDNHSSLSGIAAYIEDFRQSFAEAL